MIRCEGLWVLLRLNFKYDEVSQLFLLLNYAVLLAKIKQAGWSKTISKTIVFDQPACLGCIDAPPTYISLWNMRQKSKGFRPLQFDVITKVMWDGDTRSQIDSETRTTCEFETKSHFDGETKAKNEFVLRSRIAFGSMSNRLRLRRFLRNFDVRSKVI